MSDYQNTKIVPGGKHDEFEQEVDLWLKSKGFLTHESPYHKTMPLLHQDLLKTRFDPTSLYVRSRADRIAIHKKISLTFEWEIKGVGLHPSGDLNLEMLPLFHHINQSNLGVKCIYICQRGFGFWITSQILPKIDDITIPTRWSPTKRVEYEQMARIYLPKMYPTFRPIKYGSGDPYVTIFKCQWSKFSPWQQLIEEELANNTEKLY